MADQEAGSNRAVSDAAAGAKRLRPLVWLLLKGGLLAGLGALLLLGLGAVLIGWLTGGEGTPGFIHDTPRNPPLSLAAASSALVDAFFLLVKFGPPLFPVAAIVGATIAVGRGRLSGGSITSLAMLELVVVCAVIGCLFWMSGGWGWVLGNVFFIAATLGALGGAICARVGLRDRHRDTAVARVLLGLNSFGGLLGVVLLGMFFAGTTPHR